jgi:predicted TIM-barrel fold metal-dependent hydrolase
MSLTLEREPATRAAQKLMVVDCDIHPTFKSNADLFPFLPPRWREHWATYGGHLRQGLSSTLAHPRMYPAVSRADSWPPNGGPPGSDLAFMRSHHLDANGIEFGILMALRPGGCDERNLDFGAALCAATNDWQIAAWCEPEPRLRAAIQVPQEDPVAAVREIERCARDPRFVQVNLAPRTDEPLGRRRYWPIYEAAAAAGLPVGLHISGVPGHASTGAGWPSFYMQEHHANSQCLQAVVTSLVLEGVLERIPTLKVVIVEAGFAWAPSLCWRLDKHWERMRGEVPHVVRPPSAYVREHFWYTTQPIEEPERPEDLNELIDWVGPGKIMFSTDYPHWDFDDPRYTFRAPLKEPTRSMIFRDNARALYGLSP